MSYGKFLTPLLAAAALALCAPAQAGPQLDSIKARGSFKCSLGPGTAGFGFPDDKGVWQGFNVNICRAVAVALFNDPMKTEIVAQSTQQRIPALQTGEIDLISASLTMTLVRDSQLGFNFAPPVFYDGQGFMVAKKLNVKKATELNGATACLLQGSTSEQNVSDFFRRNNISFKSVVFENIQELRTAFFSGRCDMFSGDVSALAALRVVATNPDDFVILPERISKEPLAPATRHGDDQWADIVRWSIYTMIEAEELGITSANVDEKLTSGDPGVRRLLGVDPGLGQALGLDQKFAYNIIKKVGNYGESYEKWLGSGSKLQIARGLNDLWSKGGMMYSPPFR